MFIPLGDDNRSIGITPVVVWLIFAINCAVWILQLNLGEKFLFAFATTPYEISKGVDLAQTVNILAHGERIPLEHSAGPRPIYITLLTAMFMHGSWMHIIGNMMYLLIFGDQIEDRLGHCKFLLFYLACGFAASLAHIMADPSSMIPSLGASGAIAGVLGAYAVTHPTNRVRVMVFRHITYMPAIVVLGGWILLQFAGQAQSNLGQSSGVAYMAHIGGFVVGVLGIFLLPRRRYYTA